MGTPQQRILAIDVFRALTMLLMIFVNDLWTLNHIPEGLEHTKADEDGMGLADVVFPCFLFIVGMSLPWSLKSRIQRGDTHTRILRYIFSRTIALLVMGVFIVNLDNLNETATGLIKSWFTLLMILGFFLIWNQYTDPEKNKRFFFYRLAGVALLIFLSLKYQGDQGGELVGMRVQWWGILGLIGWAYLGNALWYLLVRGHLTGVISGWLFFVALNILTACGWLSYSFAPVKHALLTGDGAFHAFTAAGMIASGLLQQTSKYKRFSNVFLSFFISGIVCLAAGFLLREFFIISKIRATPPWVLICTGISFLAFIPLYYLIDVKKSVSLFRWVRAAGVATLTCYLIPYIWYSVSDLLNLHLPEIIRTGIPGLAKSMIFSLLIVGVTSLLVKWGIKLRV